MSYKPENTLFLPLKRTFYARSMPKHMETREKHIEIPKKHIEYGKKNIT